MTNPAINPQPNYSGVTIQIMNPAVNVGSDGRSLPCINSGYCGVVQNGLPNYQNNNYVTYPQGVNQGVNQGGVNALNSNAAQNPGADISEQKNNPYRIPVYSRNNNADTGYSGSYPAQYYLNNYNYAVNGNDAKDSVNAQSVSNKTSETEKTDVNSVSADNDKLSYYNEQYVDTRNTQQRNDDYTAGRYRMYAQGNGQADNDMSKSDNIKEDLAEREAELNEEKKNTKETKIVALTDEYIKSLENYLNNPNDEIRLMASKEILTRLDEDKDRYDDAALNALLNKMMQDPNKLVRIAALSAFSSQLASGNDYTVKLLHNIQSNPNSDKEDVLQAADILLKMAAGVEVKNIPNPSVKDKEGK